jgi:hypothetical protein
VQTRWTLPRNRAEENQDRTWSNWATFHQPKAFEYDPTSINKNLRVNAAVGKGKPRFAPACQVPLSIVSANRVVCCGMCRPFRIPKARTRQSEIWKTRAHPKRDACLAECTPGEVQSRQSEIGQNDLSRIPLCSTKHFWVAFDPSCGVATFTICCTLFTNCCTWLREAKMFALHSQTVCKLLHIVKMRSSTVPPPARHFLIGEGANAGNVDGQLLQKRAEDHWEVNDADNQFGDWAPRR